MNPTVGGLLDDAARNLAASADLIEARREAQILFGHAMGVSRAWLSAHRDDAADPSAVEPFRELIRRRRIGEPVAYLVGRREFYGLEFRVTPDVLIPRADTETLVDAALEKLVQGAQPDVLDLGTGSGCIAIAMAHERPAARVTAVDVSAAALIVARENAVAIGVDVELVQGAWLKPLTGRRFDLIVSNPPYVATGDLHLQQGDLRFEPATALASGEDGLADIRVIVADAPAYLREGGWLLFEHGYEQAEICRDLLLDAGFGEVISRADIAGLPRVSGGRLLTSKSPTR
ncbi:MAG: peptide chain release factor N(5)-glutamine methyltransferase [Betaproteobacteria bacterium]|nr:peptide chain release factor N(5)-glutamine methyltransferase [Betaproteobacteria bacterium]